MKSAQVCTFAGISYRRLDHRCRTGRVIDVDPGTWHGSGVHREFTVRQARYLRVVAECVRAGLTLDVACEVAPRAIDGAAEYDLGGGLRLTLPPSLVTVEAATAATA